MKKIMYLILLAFVVVSCGSYRSLDLSSLKTGMSKAEVRSLIGAPNRVLAVNNTNDGYQEILEYRTSRDEVYALEFWNDFLTGYEFLYDDIDYAPITVAPVRPAPGIPLFPPNYRPNRPHRPSGPNYSNRPDRPSTPSYPSRPSQPNHPEQDRPHVDNSNVIKPTPTPAPTPGATPVTRPAPVQPKTGMTR